QLSTDLDWIVMKCLEKDRTRRYETANGLATDIARHLSHEPIVARPPSRLYRFQKTVQRNKLAFGVGLVVAIAPALGLVLLSISNVRIDAVRRAERAERQKVEAANQQLRETLHLLEHTRLNENWPRIALPDSNHIVVRRDAALPERLANQSVISFDHLD